jgi:hypothetical protein
MAVNLSFIGGAGWQFFDNNGVPLAGGKLYTYVAGSTTPQTTFTSRNGNIANTNPIILDSAGRTPEQIWSTEGVLYKYVVETADNTLIRSWDNIGGSVVASDLAQDLANTSNTAEGDALIGFRQSNSTGNLPDTVGRTVHQKLQESVSVKDFGAIGDGVTDDTAAIQAALTAGENSVVYFPSGIYRCTATLNVSNNSTLSGYSAILDYSSAPTFAARVRIDGSIGSTVSLTTNLTANSISFDVASVSGLAQNDLILISSTAQYAVSGQNIGELALIRNIVGNTITLESPVNNVFFTADSAVIQKITPKDNVNIFGLTILGKGSSSSGGVPITTGEIGFRPTYCKNLIVKDCTIKYCDTHGIRISNCFAPKIQNNYILHDNVEGNPQIVGAVLQPIQYGISLLNATCSSLISGNTVINGKHGIVWTEDGTGGGYNDIIDNNYIEGTWAAGISTHESNFFFNVSNNTLKGCTAGINIRVRTGIVSNNIIHSSTTYYSTISEQGGIELTLKARNLKISDNFIFGYRFGIRVTSYDSSQVASDMCISNNFFDTISQRAIWFNQPQNNDPIENTVIENNTFKNTVGDNIFLDGNFINAVVKGNTFQNSNSVGVNPAVRLGGTNKTNVFGNMFNNIVPVQVQLSTNTSPAISSNLIIANNVCDITSGILGGAPSGLIIKNNINNRTNPNVTIVSGAITIAAGSPLVIVDTEGLAASDDLNTISSGFSGDLVVFKAISSSRTVVFKDGTGNLRLAGDFSLDNTEDSIALIWTGSVWQEVSRSDNGA